MTVKITTESDRTRVALNGMLDTASASGFMEQMKPLLGQDKINLLIDLTELTYISSQGIRTILTVIKTMMSQKGTLEFTGIRPAVMEILDMSGISEVMTIVK